MDEYGWRELRSPLTPEMLAPSRSGRGRVQFNTLLSDDDFRRVASWLSRYPRMTLRAYGSSDNSIRDLEFLRFFPFVHSFQVDAVWHSLESLDGLRFLPESLDELVIGWTKKRLDLSVLGRFRNLRTLYLEGHTKNIEVVSGLVTLEDLTLRSISLPDLSALLPLRRLLSLDIKLGGTKDLRLLPQIGQIRYRELWMIRGLADISAVSGMVHLRYLFLQALKNVVALPDMSRLTALRRVDLETMKGVRELGPLAKAPALEQVALIDMRHLKPEDLRPLAGLPGLRAVTYGLGSQRKNEAARAIVSLPEVEGPFDWRAD